MVMASRGPSGRTSPDEFVERLRELVATNVAESTRLVSRFNDFVRVALQSAGPRGAGERADSEELLSRWLDFNLESYSVINAQGMLLLNGLLSAAENAFVPKAPVRGSSATPSPRIELRLSARHGERATTGFVIENHFDRPLAITFQSTELVPTAGASLSASLVSFEPATLEIAPRGQGTVQVAVMITTNFVVGQTYTAAIRLVGFDAKDVGLLVTVLPHEGALSQADPSPKRRKSTKKPRWRKKT
jgi:hypothetical protein